MREQVQINYKPYIFFTPGNDDQFEAILDLTRAVHGEGAAALSRSLYAGMPGMHREDWYGLARPDDWPDGMRAPARVVSTLCRIPTGWTCRDVGVNAHLPSAELGMVASARDARGCGLSSWLMKRFQADSIKAGFSLSTIQGIPYFYRRFGYEYAVPLIPKILLHPGLVAAKAWSVEASSQEKQVTEMMESGSRRAIETDIPLMSAWFNEVSSSLGIRADRSDVHWLYLMGKAQLSFETAVERRILLDGAGKPVGWLGFQRDCFGPTMAIAEASLPDLHTGWSAVDMLALAESIRIEEGMPHITVLLPRSHPLAIAAAGLGGQLCREYAWQVAILDRPDFFGRLRPVLEARLRSSVLKGGVHTLSLDLYGENLRFDWDGKRLEITQLSDPTPAEGPDGQEGTGQEGTGQATDQSQGQPEDGIDTMPEKPVSAFPPELLGPLALGYRGWQELGHCRRDVMIRPEDRAFMDVLFPVMDSFIYPLF